MATHNEKDRWNFNAKRREQIYFPNPDRRMATRAMAAAAGKSTSEFVNELIRVFEFANPYARARGMSFTDYIHELVNEKEEKKAA